MLTISNLQSESVRVLLLTSTRALARGFEAFAAEQDGIDATVCTDPESLCATAAAANPSVILLDVNGQIDLTTVTAVRESVPECRIVVWTASLSVEVAHQARIAGVHGVLYKDSSDQLMVVGLKAVAAGELWFPRALLHGLLNVREVRLSPRERQLTELVSRGFSNKQIGAELAITEGTVKVYMAKLFRKVGVQDRYELALHGLRNLGVSGVTAGSSAPVGMKTLVVANGAVAGRPASAMAMHAAA